MEQVLEFSVEHNMATCRYLSWLQVSFNASSDGHFNHMWYTKFLLWTIRRVRYVGDIEYSTKMYSIRTNVSLYVSNFFCRKRDSHHIDRHMILDYITLNTLLPKMFY